MSNLRYRRFLVANAAGGLLWGVGYTLAGYFAGKALSRVESVTGWATVGVLVAIAVFVVWHVLRRRRRDAALEIEWHTQHPEADNHDS
jgi:membrane protein DedA with SNARE-associated domain